MSTDQVEQVKQKVDIVEVIGEKVALKKAGRHYKGLCPFHAERSPSFIVSPERQSFKCFGCQEGGDVFSFLQRYDGMSFLESLELLAKRVGVTLESYRPTSQDAEKKKKLQLLDLSAEYYHYLLTKHASGASAREYLKSRGITDSSIAHFKLGYAPPSWRSLADYLVKKKGYSEQEVQETGMTIKSDSGRYYERFRERVMFPLRDARGIVVGFSGRTISADKTEAKYINSPETQLYHKSRMLYGLYENREYVRKEDKIILVEGELDVIPSYQAGVKNVVAIKGSAFTEQQAQLIARYTRNIYMALDADQAGEEAIKRAVNIADSMEMSIRVVQIKGGKDPGDVATEDGKAWRESVKSAVLYFDFLIDSVSRKYENSSGEGAALMSTQVVPVLANISNVVVRAHYVTQLAARLKVPEESVYAEIERVQKKRELQGLKKAVEKIEKGAVLPHRQMLEEYLLSLALQHYKSLLDELRKVESVWFVTRSIKRIIEALQAHGSAEFSIQKFASSLPEELQEMIDKAYLRELGQVGDIKREWGKIVVEVEEAYLKARLTDLSVKIAQAEQSDKQETTEIMQAEFAKISRQLAQISK